MTIRVAATTLFCTVCLTSPSWAGDNSIVTLESVPEELEDIVADEAMAKEFSLDLAARYIDRAALTWQKQKKCATCHTNMGYLFARPALAGVLKDSGEVREFYIKSYLKGRWAKKMPTENQGFWPIVVGAGLTINDVQTTGKLSDEARQVLDIMWTVQREDGGWRWPDCDYAPMEIDDHYGVTVAALAVGIAPDGYAETASRRKRVIAGDARKFFENDPRRSRCITVRCWPGCRSASMASSTQSSAKKRWRELARACRTHDGGWSTAAFLTDWKGGIERKDGEPLAVDSQRRLRHRIS